MSFLAGPSSSSSSVARRAGSRACRNCRSVSTRTVAVKLVQPVLGLGQPGDVVSVNPGRMRTSLHPSGQAVYVAWKRKADLNAYVEAQQELQRAVASSSTAPQISYPSSSSGGPSLDSLSALSSELDHLPSTLTFSERTIAESENLFGSVSLADILARLQADHGLTNELAGIRWSESALASDKVLNGERVRETGRYKVWVGAEGTEKDVVVEVVALQE